MRPERVGLDRGIAQHHVGDDHLAALAAGRADHGALDHGRMGGAGLTPALGRSLERRGLFETVVESMPLAAN